MDLNTWLRTPKVEREHIWLGLIERLVVATEALATGDRRTTSDLPCRACETQGLIRTGTTCAKRHWLECTDCLKYHEHGRCTGELG